MFAGDLFVISRPWSLGHENEGGIGGTMAQMYIIFLRYSKVFLNAYLAPVLT